MKTINRILVAFAFLASFAFGQQPQNGNSPTRTTLSAAITSSQTAVTVAATTGCPASGTFNPVSNPCDLVVGREAMHILAINGTSLTVERGANGMQGEAYPSGTAAFIGSTSVFRNVPFPQYGDWNLNTQFTWYSVFSSPNEPSPTQVTDVNGKIWYAAIQIPASTVLTGACQMNGNGTLADKMVFGLWDRNGTVLAQTAAAGVTQSGTSVLQCQSFSNPVIVQGPATYYVGVQGNGTTAASIAAIPSGGAPTNYPTGVQTGGTFGTIGNITSPATTFTAGVGPIMSVF